MAPNYEFIVEVHDGVRLPDRPDVPAQQRGALHNATAGKSLVPLHFESEAVGGHSNIYRPHPSALQHTNAEGPYLTQGPASWLRQIFKIHHSGLAWFAMAAMILLILAALSTSIERCKTLLDALFGPGSRGGFPLFMVLAVVLGTTLSWPELARSFSGTAALVFSINLVIIALYVPELIQKRRQPDKTPH